MGLSCGCESDFDDLDAGDKFWMDPVDYTPLATKRARKCCSCAARIKVGELCAEVRRFKIPESDDKEKPLASAWMCEGCADLCFSLMALGYCAEPWTDQRELLADYVYRHAPAETPNT